MAESYFLRLASQAHTHFPFMHQFRVDSGLTELEDPDSFWSSMDQINFDSDKGEFSNGTDGHSAGPHLTKLDRERNSLHGRLDVKDAFGGPDSDDDDGTFPNMSNLLAPQPSLPPTHLPLPAQPPPALLSESTARASGDGGEGRESSWESVRPARSSTPADSRDLRAVFSKCCSHGISEGADIR